MFAGNCVKAPAPLKTPVAHARVRAPQGVFVDFGGLRDHASLLYGRGSVTLGRSDRCTYVNNPERTATLATIAQT